MRTFWGVLNVTLHASGAQLGFGIAVQILGKGGSDDFCVSQGAPTDPLEEVMIFGDTQSLLGELMGIKVGFQGVKEEPS